MANEIQIDVKIDGLGKASIDVKQLTNALDGLSKPTKDAQKNLSNIEGSLQSLASKGFDSFKIAAIGAIGAVTALFAGKEMIQAAVEKEKVVNDLNVTLSQLGIYSKKTSEDLQNFADQLEKTTKFSDDQVISTINLLGSMTNLDQKGLKSASKAALDLASTLNLDLNTATMLVSKSIEGNNGALARYGIQVKKGASESENLSNTLQALSKFAGRSEKDLLTFGGALSFLKNGFDELLTALGMIIVKDPLISKFIKTVGEGFFAIADSVKNASLSITDWIIKILEVITELGVKFTTVSKVIETVITGALVVAVVSLTSAFATFVATSIAGMTTFATVANAAFGGLLVILGGLTYLLVDAKEEVGSWSNLFTKAILNVQIGFKYLLVIVEEVKSQIIGMVNSIQEPLYKLRNTLYSLAGKEEVKFDFNSETLKEGTKRAQTLIVEIDNMQSRINSMQESAKKDKQTDLFASSLEGLKTLKIEMSKLQDNLKNTGTGRGDSLSKETTEKIRKDFEDLYKSLDGMDQGELGRAKAVYEQKKKIIQEFIFNNKKEEAKGIEALLLLDAEYQKQKTDLEKKGKEEREKIRNEEISRAKANPLGELFGAQRDLTKEVEFVFKPKLQGIFEGLAEGLAKGKEGATALMSSLAAEGIDMLLPGVGKIAKPLLDAFSQGPEATKKMVQDFLSAIPLFVTNVISSIPAFFQAIIKEAPKLINSLIRELPKVIKEFQNQIPVITQEFLRSLPEIVSSLAIQMPTVAWSLALNMPMVAVNFATSLVQQLPYIAYETAKALVNEVKNAFSNFGNLFGGGESGGLFGIGVLGLAQGGKIVKGGIQGKDSVPIATMPGELIVDKSLTEQMQSFFDNNVSGNNNEITNALLDKILVLLSRPQEISTNVQLNQRTLAEILINLNRTNSRVTA